MKRLERDKYIEIFRKEIDELLENAIFDEDTFSDTLFFDPGAKIPLLIDTDDRRFLIDCISESKEGEMKWVNDVLAIEIERPRILIYYKDKCNFIRCQSIADYLAKISILSQDKSLYYRGQASHYEWIPSLFRKESWVENEAVLNARVISRHVDEFKDCDSTIERLIKLKHFNQPSRLYDIVANPLMALFFACESWS